MTKTCNIAKNIRIMCLSAISRSGISLTLVLLTLTLLLPPVPAYATNTWTQTSQADFESGTLYQVDTASSPGDVRLAKVSTASNYIYAFYGGSTSFTRYDISGNSWSGMTSAPATVGIGGALAYDGGDYIYAFRGGSTSTFWRYTITDNSWTTLASPPAPNTIGAGAALAYDGSDYIYALRGNGSSAFWRYSISGNSWSTLANVPSTVGDGGALAYDGGNYIYALRGNSQNSFYRYSISGNSWSTMANLGAGNRVGAGGSLAYDGGDYIYALRGNNSNTFRRYSISGNSWTSMTNTPANVRYGGALAYSSSSNLYAMRGNSSNTFWQYSVSGNSWTAMTTTLANVTSGGALAMGGPAYRSSGTLESSSHDTGYAADFNTVSWTTDVPSNTLVRFQIATNNDNATWDFKGTDGASGTYYTASGTGIWSGHDGDRYIKYKAFLTTSDSSLTPVLHDVSISFTQQIAAPTVTTDDATSVEEATATLNGMLDNGGGEACEYRFEYDTDSGEPYSLSTSWTGSITTGQSFSTGITGLSKGTKYYFRAQVRNSAGTVSGSELTLLTKPDPPVSVSASAVSSTSVTLNWTKGEGASRTMIRRKTESYPVDVNDGIQVYFDTGTSVTDTGLAPNTTYYYKSWSEVTGSQQWSSGFAVVVVTTGEAPPPVTIGGQVNRVNKAEVLATYLSPVFIILTIVATGLYLRKRLIFSSLDTNKL
jgi:hypothetical protein